MKEKTFDILKVVVQDNFKKFLDQQKTPVKNSILDKLMETIVQHYFDNKYISKKAENVYEGLLHCSMKHPSFLQSITQSLVKMNQSSN